MATSSKRISELNLFTKTQHNPIWYTCILPANFASDIDPQYPDTFKVAMSSLMMSIQDASFSGDVTFLKSVSADAPLYLGSKTQRSAIFIFKGISNQTTNKVTLTNTNNTNELIIPINSTWFFKSYTIGVSKTNQCTSIEHVGIVQRLSDGNIYMSPNIGEPSTKIIHVRSESTSDAFIEVNNLDTKKTIDIKVIGGSLSNSYTWTTRLDIVQV
jgi:hypothetical protein